MMINDYYAKILARIRHQIKIKNWTLAHQLIQTELNLPYVPTPISQKLKILLQQVQPHLKTPPRKFLTADEILQFLTNPDLKTDSGIGFIHQLQTWNVKSLLSSIQKLLLNPDFNPHLKTHLCLLLKDQNITTPVTIYKADQIQLVVPSQIVDFPAHQQIVQTMEILKSKITNYDFTIYNFALKILRHYFDFAFPHLDLIVEPRLAAATIYGLAQKSLGIPVEYSKISDKFQVERSLLESTIVECHSQIWKWT